MGWEGVLKAAKEGGPELFYVSIRSAAEIVPLGESVSIVVTSVREAHEHRRVTSETATTLIENIQRNHATLKQIEENQMHDNLTTHKPVVKVLKDYVKLLGLIKEVCEKWSSLNCMMQMCGAKKYRDRMEDLSDKMAHLRADLTLANLVKMDGEARIRNDNVAKGMHHLDQAATGRHEETSGKLKEAIVRQTEVLSKMADLKTLMEEGVENAVTMQITTRWDSILRFDWDSTAKESVQDAARVIAVGLSNVAGQSQKLLIQMINTEEENDMRSGKQILQQSPVWAIALSATDIKTIMEKMRGATQDIVIHSEPMYPEEGEKWMIQAAWVPFETGKEDLMQLRLSVKASQETHPTVHRVRFVVQAKMLRKIGNPIDETVFEIGWQEKLTLAYNDAVHDEVNNPRLPAPSYTGPEPIVFPSTAKELDTSFVPEGAGVIELELDLERGRTLQSGTFVKGVPSLCQSLLSGRLLARNPMKETLRIRQVYTELKLANWDDFQKCVLPDDNDSYVASGATCVGYYKGQYMMSGKWFPQVEWIRDSTAFEIPPEGTVELVIRGNYIVAGTKAYNGHPLDLRLHKSIADPVTVRATLVDADDKTKTISWQFTNDPLVNRSWTNYEEFLAAPAERDPTKKLWQERKLVGIGDDYQCDLWMYVDNPVNLMRIYAVITSPKKDPDHWIIRVANTTDTFPPSYQKVQSSDLKRLVYDAQKAGTSIVDMSKKWSGARDCKLSLLIDLKRGVAYGLDVELCISCEANIVSKQCIYLDQERVRERHKED